MAIRYAVLGAGRQGTAAGYALARFYSAGAVDLVDARETHARSAAARINALLGREVARPRAVDALSSSELEAILAGSAAVVSALPYPLNPAAARAAIAARAHFTDLGGNTSIVEDELKLDAEARAAGVSLVPDSGLAPGLANALAALALDRLPAAREVRMWCGGLPQTPKGPLGYKLVFHIGGLTNEYTGKAVLIRDGRVVEIPAMTELEEIEFPPPVGRAEAFLTSGGTSTCPKSFAGRLNVFEYKTVRYPGHFQRIAPLVELGFLGTEPVDLNGQSVVPRELAHRLLAPHIDYPADPDLVVLRVEAKGGGRRLRFEMLDRADSATGFSAMERSTAFPAAALAHLQAEGGVAPGAHRLELAFDRERYLALVLRTGLPIEADDPGAHPAPSAVAR